MQLTSGSSPAPARVRTFPNAAVVLAMWNIKSRDSHESDSSSSSSASNSDTGVAEVEVTPVGMPTSSDCCEQSASSQDETYSPGGDCDAAVDHNENGEAAQEPARVVVLNQGSAGPVPAVRPVFTAASVHADRVDMDYENYYIRPDALTLLRILGQKATIPGVRSSVARTLSESGDGAHALSETGNLDNGATSDELLLIGPPVRVYISRTEGPAVLAAIQARRFTVCKPRIYQLDLFALPDPQ